MIRPIIFLSAILIVKSQSDDDLINTVVRCNHEELIEMLADGADVNHKTKEDESLLHLSSIYCNTQCIKTLLEAGADVNAITKSGETLSMTPLHWFVNMNNCEEE